MKGKPKKQSLSTLTDKADRLASTHIRQKYANHAGEITCITCGSVHHWKDSHCAHYVERRFFATRYVEENLHPACPHCNAFNKEFHKRQYTLFMLDTYGRDKIDELVMESRRTLSPSEKRAIVEEAIDYYGQLLREREAA
jgi:hypothetical protein